MQILMINHALYQPKAAFTWDRIRWNRYEIGTDKPCVYTGPRGSGTDRISYLVLNGSTCEDDPMWNPVPYQFKTGPV